MFSNVGKKIKSWATGYFRVGCVVSVLAALLLFIQAAIEGLSHGVNYLISALLVFGIGLLLTWYGSLMLYGFGELIDKVCDIEKALRGNTGKSSAQLKEEAERKEKIEELRTQGLITEEEYKKILM